MTSAELPALLRSVKLQPEDDLPRFVLADWLEEHGDLARAEFIRVQCRLARLAADDPEVLALRQREAQLRRTHAARWVGGLRRFTRFSIFERGLLFLQVSAADAFLHVRGQAERRPEVYDWVSGLHFPWAHPGRFLERFAKQAEAFAGLTHLKLGFAGNDRDFTRFVELPQLLLLTHLDLALCDIGDAGVKSLAHSPYLSRLTALGLDHNQVRDKGIAELANSPTLGRLVTLSLAGNPITDRGADLLARSTCLRSLQTVSIFGQLTEDRLSPFGEEILRQRFGGNSHGVSLTMPTSRHNVRDPRAFA